MMFVELLKFIYEKTCGGKKEEQPKGSAKNPSNPFNKEPNNSQNTALNPQIRQPVYNDAPPPKPVDSSDSSSSSGSGSKDKEEK